MTKPRIILELENSEVTPQSIYLDMFGFVRDRESYEFKGHWNWVGESR